MDSTLSEFQEIPCENRRELLQLYKQLLQQKPLTPEKSSPNQKTLDSWLIRTSNQSGSQSKTKSVEQHRSLDSGCNHEKSDSEVDKSSEIEKSQVTHRSNNVIDVCTIPVCNQETKELDNSTCEKSRNGEKLSPIVLVEKLNFTAAEHNGLSDTSIAREDKVALQKAVTNVSKSNEEVMTDMLSIKHKSKTKLTKEATLNDAADDALVCDKLSTASNNKVFDKSPKKRTLRSNSQPSTTNSKFPENVSKSESLLKICENDSLNNKNDPSPTKKVRGRRNLRKDLFFQNQKVVRPTIAVENEVNSQKGINLEPNRINVENISVLNEQGTKVNPKPKGKEAVSQAAAKEHVNTVSPDADLCTFQLNLGSDTRSSKNKLRSKDQNVGESEKMCHENSVNMNSSEKNICNLMQSNAISNEEISENAVKPKKQKKVKQPKSITKRAGNTSSNDKEEKQPKSITKRTGNTASNDIMSDLRAKTKTRQTAKALAKGKSILRKSESDMLACDEQKKENTTENNSSNLKVENQRKENRSSMEETLSIVSDSESSIDIERKVNNPEKINLNLRKEVAVNIREICKQYIKMNQEPIKNDHKNDIDIDSVDQSETREHGDSGVNTELCSLPLKSNIDTNKNSKNASKGQNVIKSENCITKNSVEISDSKNTIFNLKQNKAVSDEGILKIAVEAKEKDSMKKQSPYKIKRLQNASKTPTKFLKNRLIQAKSVATEQLILEKPGLDFLSNNKRIVKKRLLSENEEIIEGTNGVDKEISEQECVAKLIPDNSVSKDCTSPSNDKLNENINQDSEVEARTFGVNLGSDTVTDQKAVAISKKLSKKTVKKINSNKKQSGNTILPLESKISSAANQEKETNSNTSSNVASKRKNTKKKLLGNDNLVEISEAESNIIDMKNAELNKGIGEKNYTENVSMEDIIVTKAVDVANSQDCEIIKVNSRKDAQNSIDIPIVPEERHQRKGSSNSDLCTDAKISKNQKNSEVFFNNIGHSSTDENILQAEGSDSIACEFQLKKTIEAATLENEKKVVKKLSEKSQSIDTLPLVDHNLVDAAVNELEIKDENNKFSTSVGRTSLIDNDTKEDNTTQNLQLFPPSKVPTEKRKQKRKRRKVLKDESLPEDVTLNTVISSALGNSASISEQRSSEKSKELHSSSDNIPVANNDNYKAGTSVLSSSSINDHNSNPTKKLTGREAYLFLKNKCSQVGLNLDDIFRTKEFKEMIEKHKNNNDAVVFFGSHKCPVTNKIEPIVKLHRSKKKLVEHITALHQRKNSLNANPAEK